MHKYYLFLRYGNKNMANAKTIKKIEGLKKATTTAIIRCKRLCCHLKKQRNNPIVVVVVKAKKTQQQNKQHPEIFSHSNHIYAIFYVK